MGNEKSKLTDENPAKPSAKKTKLSKELQQIKKDAQKTLKLQCANQQIGSIIPFGLQDLSFANKIQEVWLTNCGIELLNSDFINFKSTKLVYLDKNKLAEFPRPLCQLLELEEVNLSSNREIKQIPLEVGNWTHLTSLYLSETSVRTLPASVRNWKMLRVLHINNSELSELPEEIGEITSLTQVSLCGNKLLHALPKSIGSWTHVAKLFLNANALTELPDEIAGMRALEKLYVNDNLLATLPESIGQMNSLEELYINDNQIRRLPAELCQCQALNKLYVNSNRLRELPADLGRLAGSLELLYVNRNELQELPASVGQLKKLKYLHFQDNQVTLQGVQLVFSSDLLLPSLVVSFKGNPLASHFDKDELKFQDIVTK